MKHILYLDTIHNEWHKTGAYASCIYFTVWMKIWQLSTSADKMEFYLTFILHKGIRFFLINGCMWVLHHYLQLGVKSKKQVLLPRCTHSYLHLFIIVETPLMIYFNFCRTPINEGRLSLWLMFCSRYIYLKFLKSSIFNGPKPLNYAQTYRNKLLASTSLLTCSVVKSNAKLLKEALQVREHMKPLLQQS